MLKGHIVVPLRFKGRFGQSQVNVLEQGKHFPERASNAQPFQLHLEQFRVDGPFAASYHTLTLQVTFICGSLLSLLTSFLSFGGLDKVVTRFDYEIGTLRRFNPAHFNLVVGEVGR